MAIQTSAGKNAAASGYAGVATFGALYTTAPGATAGTEVTGGTYARKSITWGAPSNGVITATATFDVPAGVTIAGAGLHTAATGGSYIDGGTVTSQQFATAGQYVLQMTFTQS
jgi:hypothetical protein